MNLFDLWFAQDFNVIFNYIYIDNLATVCVVTDNLMIITILTKYCIFSCFGVIFLCIFLFICIIYTVNYFSHSLYNFRFLSANKINCLVFTHFLWVITVLCIIQTIFHFIVLFGVHVSKRLWRISILIQYWKQIS